MSNVKMMFEVERDATNAALDQIAALDCDGWSLEGDFDQLAGIHSWEKAGSADFWRGALGIILMGLVALFTFGEDAQLDLLIIGATSIFFYFFCLGLYRHRRAVNIRLSFIEKHNELEGEIGWLWKYENFIRMELAKFPENMQDTFAGTIRASREHCVPTTREELLNYWGWVRVIRDRLAIFKEVTPGW